MVPAGPAAPQNDAPTSHIETSEPSGLVGRAAELAELARAFDHARSGRRQLVLVTGEPGIGKSSLADAFLEQLRGAHAARIAHGQCLDHHGVGESYLPLIEALTRLAGAPDGAVVKRILAAQAPSWLAQMPSLWTRSERNALETRGRATRERMLRERRSRPRQWRRISAADQARGHSLERRLHARLARTYRSPSGAGAADGAGHVPAR
jgi:hypothetical protein